MVEYAGMKKRIGPHVTNHAAVSCYFRANLIERRNRKGNAKLIRQLRAVARGLRDGTLAIVRTRKDTR